MRRRYLCFETVTLEFFHYVPNRFVCYTWFHFASLYFCSSSLSVLKRLRSPQRNFRCFEWRHATSCHQPSLFFCRQLSSSWPGGRKYSWVPSSSDLRRFRSEKGFVVLRCVTPSRHLPPQSSITCCPLAIRWPQVVVNLSSGHANVTWPVMRLWRGHVEVTSTWEGCAGVSI